MRERPRPYIPGDWYWIVGGDTGQVFSSRRDGYVGLADSEYVAWVAGGNRATRIDSEATLNDVLREHRHADDINVATQYAKLRALADMTPAQVSAWVDANVTNLATAQDAIKTLAIAVSVLARRLLGA